MPIVFDRSVCRDPERALGLEWLVANGLGGYASSTIVGANTRRYHGLLVAAIGTPRSRWMLVSKVDEEIEAASVVYALGTNEYGPGTIHPCGFVHLEEFRLEDGLPVWIYRGGGWELEKRLWMAHGQNTTYLTYTLTRSPEPVLLTLRPLVNYRDFHGVTRGRADWDFRQLEKDRVGCCILQAFEGAHPFAIRTAPAMEHVHTGYWYWNFLYRKERERGLEHTEDLYAPGILRRQLTPGETQAVILSTETDGRIEWDAARALEEEKARRKALLQRSPLAGQGEEACALILAADTFIVHLAPSGQPALPGTSMAATVIAGYPWFGDWGRDTMISLPGLFLATGRAEEAAAVLRTYARYVDQGMLPNRFPESGETPEYNTVDATLWFFVALHRYVRATGDLDLARELYPLLVDIIEWHARGTRYGIGVDPKDGLLRAGTPGVQLTWMDAKVEDWVVTPRHGKPVEVNALWYNALRVLDALGALLRRRSGRSLARTLAEQVGGNFLPRFWYAPGGYLYDVVDGPAGDDPSLRPNQLLALSLPFPLVTGEKARSVLRTVRAELLTPVGLRTLSPKDPAYHGRYEGDRWQRDAAYHQGTVWPWWIGPYITAVRRLEDPQADIRSLLRPLLDHLKDAGVGTISEIFDGDPPHTPRGCIAQAWSVAEVLRVWYEALQTQPNARPQR
ncbi:MAG: amylo-alpha-1,6-glucosidase [Chloroflexia bacterium]